MMYNTKTMSDYVTYTDDSMSHTTDNLWRYYYTTFAYDDDNNVSYSRDYLFEMIAKYALQLLKIDEIPRIDTWNLVKDTELEQEFLKRYDFSSKEEVELYFSASNALKDGTL